MHMVKATIRPVVATGLLTVIVGMWVYQTIHGTGPDTMLSLLVFLGATVSLLYLFGKGTVSAAVKLVKELQT